MFIFTSHWDESSKQLVTAIVFPYSLVNKKTGLNVYKRYCKVCTCICVCIVYVCVCVFKICM